ncbi:MAG: Xaa-Pro dipeptidase [Gammaproteobacteria bacterium]|nr:Xaa-Pro dipeptidase [Gammaproteobacteria bacterium]
MDARCSQRHPEHLRLVASRWTEALEASGFEAVVVGAGRPRFHLFDDLAPSFRPNPHFTLWFPEKRCEGAALLFTPGSRPALYFHSPADYWHQPAQAPDWAAERYELRSFEEAEDLEAAVSKALRNHRRVAFIGESPPGSWAVEANPAPLIRRLHHQRAWKTGFEVACLERATEHGVRGHIAAREAYRANGSEFDILGAFLTGSGQTEAEAPYPCIIGRNEHAAVLHYQNYDRSPPADDHGFLIDAGASHLGYGSDISRTWPGRDAAAFAELIAALDEQQRALIETIRPGLNYLDLHLAMHRRIGELLSRFELVRCSDDAAYELGLTRTFMPHGLGHLLGVQTHDVGGWQTTPEGGETPPPDAHATLRLTRTIEADMVFTIEPGLYFIPMLLSRLRQEASAREVNWPLVETMTPSGGARIEDNVLVTEDGVRNLTREAFAALDPS